MAVLHHELDNYKTSILFVYLLESKTEKPLNWLLCFCFRMFNFLIFNEARGINEGDNESRRVVSSGSSMLGEQFHRNLNKTPILDLGILSALHISRKNIFQVV